MPGGDHEVAQADPSDRLPVEAHRPDLRADEADDLAALDRHQRGDLVIVPGVLERRGEPFEVERGSREVCPQQGDDRGKVRPLERSNAPHIG